MGDTEYMATIGEAFANVLKQHPSLTGAGFDPYDGRYRRLPSQEKAKFVTYRQMLVNDGETVQRVCEILATMSRTPTLNRNHTSYGFKHLFEDLLGDYVSNGACIAAAYISNVRIKRCEHGSLNAYFNLDEKEIELLDEHVYRQGKEDGKCLWTHTLLSTLGADKHRGKPGKFQRIPLSNKERFAIFKRDHYRCQICGIAATDGPEVRLVIDHIIAVVNGGTNADDNLWTLCHECNDGKRAQSL